MEVVLGVSPMHAPRRPVSKPYRALSRIWRVDGLADPRERRDPGVMYLAHLIAALLAHIGQDLDDARARAATIGAAYAGDIQEGPDGLNGKDLQVAVDSRRDRILHELESITPDAIWGTYREGDGTGMNVELCIAPENGATYTWHGCLGLYDANHGAVVHVEDRTIRLALERNARDNAWWFPGGQEHPYMSSEWCVVDWAEWRFMIPASQMIPFCNDVNGGRVPYYPCRLLDGTAHRLWIRSEAPQGRPVVPDAYRLFLLEAPVVTKVLRLLDQAVVVGKYAFGEPMYRLHAEIGAGSADGLLPGMLLSPASGGDPGAEVVSIESKTARVQMHSSDPQGFPAPGVVLTTGPCKKPNRSDGR